MSVMIPSSSSPQGAILSEDGLYRYLLWRRLWDFGKSKSGRDTEGPRLLVVMLNPSTADGMTDDATIRRLRDFGIQWRDEDECVFQQMLVVNLFAWRAREPRALDSAPDPVGPECNVYIDAAAKNSALIVCAWGSTKLPATYDGRPTAVVDRLRRQGRRLYSLGLTKDGSPRHPVRLARSTRPELWML